MGWLQTFSVWLMEPLASCSRNHEAYSRESSRSCGPLQDRRWDTQVRLSRR